MGSPYIIATLLTLVLGLVIYSLLVPRNTGTFIDENREEMEDNFIVRLTSKLSNELYNSLPEGVGPKNKTNLRIENLLKKSGNPWGLRSEEFIFFQYTAAGVGALAGWLISFLVSPITGIHWGYLVAGAGIFGFFIPRIRYSEEAKKRDLEFTRHLPEILDLLTIPIIAGDDINTSIRKCLPNMPEGVLKDEFREIIKSIDTGKTTNEAFDGLAKRAPNESISAFVRAVQEANTLQVPMVEIMRSRAKASRADFFSLIHNKTAALPSKIMGVITPTLLPALIIVLVAPAAQSLVGSIG